MFTARGRPGIPVLLAFLTIAPFCLYSASAGMKAPGPGNPGGRSGDDHGRIAAFLADLDAAGFVVQKGTTGIASPLDGVNEFYIDSCSGNNAGQYYKRFLLPPHPDQAGPLDDAFRLAPDEAVVYVGKTPPLGDYFSFCPFVWTRQYSDKCVPTGDWLFAAVGDPLNNALIKTEGQGNPFQKNTIIVLSADEGVYERVRDAARSAGFPASMVNPIVLPSDVLRLGTDPQSDSLFVLVRTANLVSKAQELKYLMDDEWAKVYRVTPRVAPALRPFAQPPTRERAWVSEEELVPGLSAGLECLKAAILAKTTHVQSRPLESLRWFHDSNDVLKDDPSLPAYRRFVAGESSDTPYRRSAENGIPTHFYLSNDDMVVVYGVNHAATGIATYSNFGVYGDRVLNHCPPVAGEPVFVYGVGDPIWNGVASMTSHDFTGSAEQYIPGDPMAPYLYAVRVVRSWRALSRDRYRVIVPDTNSRYAEPPFTDIIELDEPVMIGYRAYLNPATNAGPDYQDTIPDRAIWFRLE